MPVIRTVILALAVAACGDVPTAPAPEPPVVQEVRLAWPAPDERRLTDTATSLLALVAPDQEPAGLALGPPTPYGTRFSTVTGAEWLTVTVDEPSNHVAVADSRIGTRWPAGDIGLDAAREQYHEALRVLEQRGLLWAGAAWTEPLLSYGRMGEGTRDGAFQREAVNEYRFTARPKFDGVAVGNVGVTIGIAAEDGRISTLAVGGAEIAEVRALRVDPAGPDLTQPVVDALGPPEAEVHVTFDEWMYVVRRDESRWVEPRRVLVYSVVVDGIAERGQIVAIGRDGTTELLSDPPGAHSDGDARPVVGAGD